MNSFKVTGLPDFLEDRLLNKLRDAMGAYIIEPITDLKIGILTLDEILRTTGQEIDLSEVEFASNGTLRYQGRQVILYIRDITVYKEEPTLPKFHLSNCDTLQKMWQRKRSDRYVVSTRHDGIFRIKITSDGQTWQDNDYSLYVCKNCLSKLNWNGYSGATASRKIGIFDKFGLPAFFETYPNSPITYTPTFNDVTAPVNEYSRDFSEISTRYRESVGWTCEKCHSNLSDKEFRRYLHVHHVDGAKNNNAHGNLRALCVQCHGQQDMHGHLGNSGDLTNYLSLRRQRNQRQ